MAEALHELIARSNARPPAEPRRRRIGAGASWRVVTVLRQGPAYAKQTATYTLKAMTAAGWRVHVKLQRVAEDQAIADPSLPPGTVAELIAMFRQLEGDVDVDPRQPLIVGWLVRGRVAARREDQAAVAAAGRADVRGHRHVTFSRCRPGAAGASHSFGECPDGFAP